MSRIMKLLLIVLFVIALTACSKTKPDNNLERVWEYLIAQDGNSADHSISPCNAEEATVLESLITYDDFMKA